MLSARTVAPMASLPPLSHLLKSREVEDPINVWVHRPLAYAFVSLVRHTSLTPNGVTYLATIVGLGAAASWIVGGQPYMLIGGLLLWASSILDGADGILARAKNMQSQFGRVLDGTMDLVVAVSTVGAAGYHLYAKTGDLLYVALLAVALVLTLPQINLYDFYKESFLRMTRPERASDGESVAQVAEWADRLDRERGSLLQRLLVRHVMLGMLKGQDTAIRLTNPGARREGRTFVLNEESARIYREQNVGPMRGWAIVSLCPHSYLMAICGMFDRLDIYLWVRLFGMTGIFLTLLVWQRVATRRTQEALAKIGAEPTQAPAPVAS